MTAITLLKAAVAMLALAATSGSAEEEKWPTGYTDTPYLPGS